MSNSISTALDVSEESQDGEIATLYVESLFESGRTFVQPITLDTDVELGFHRSGRYGVIEVLLRPGTEDPVSSARLCIEST